MVVYGLVNRSEEGGGWERRMKRREGKRMVSEHVAERVVIRFVSIFLPPHKKRV